MGRRDLLVAVSIPIGFVIAAGLYFWWDITRYEYRNERVVLCTVVEVVHSDQTRDGYVRTAQCGLLTFKPYGFRLEHEVEPRHTYRLRIAEIEPHRGTGIIAVEGEL